ncbi:MAG: glycosyltransferase, partial [Pseudolabrys sp.]|nr:glycosyltransferase [Pseudolabrys sp.]
MPQNPNEPAVAVIVPVRNEAGNIAPLIEEIATALNGQWPFEVIYVNDGSTDASPSELEHLQSQRA